MPKGRITDHEKSKRLLHISDLLCDGMGIREIMQDKVVATWNIERRQLNEYIKWAWAEIHEMRKESIEVKIDRAIVERDRIKLRAILKKDFRTALVAMSDRDKIEGILRDREPGFNFNFNFDTDELSPENKKRLDDELSLVFRKKK